MTLTELQASLRASGLDRFADSKIVTYLPELLNNGDKVLHVLHMNEAIEKKKETDYKLWLGVITNNKIIMLDKGIIAGLQTKIIPFDRISLCERSGKNITLNLSGSILKLSILDKLDNNIFCNVINDFLNKQYLEQAIANAKNNPESYKKDSALIDLAKLIFNNFKAILVMSVVAFIYFLWGGDDK